MTAREKYIEEFISVDLSGVDKNFNPIGCPSTYGYLCDPAWCDFETRNCYKCWSREIPGTEEKGNEDMMTTIPNETEVIEIDYKEAYEESCKVVDNLTESYEEAKKEIKGLNDILDKKDAELAKAKRQRELDLIALRERSSEIERYIFGFRVASAFLGKNVLEDYE